MKKATLLPLALVGFIAATQADDNAELIAQARSAAPSMISDNASVMINGEVVIEGTNGWVCMPETLPGDNSPNCSDGLWMELFQAFGQKAEFSPTGIGISYMLGGDGGVSNSDPYHADPTSAHDYIKEGPHLMVIVPKAVLSGMTDDPSSGEPYVMWGDTPYAHIMVPVGDR